jgi:hypothetical protein
LLDSAGSASCDDGPVAIRRPNTLRDMALSVGLLAVVALILVGMYGGVSFAPNGPNEGQALATDVTGGMQRAAPLVGFPVVIPTELPADWTPSSFSYAEEPGSATAPPAVRGGWLTAQGRFITVIESSGAPATVLTAELGAAAPPSGTELVNGAEWTVTAGRRSEAAWVRTVGDVTFVITGTASADDFSTLAQAVATEN